MEFTPLKFDAIILIDKDLELPGLPIISIGILFIKHTKVVKTFSLKAKFIAIFVPGLTNLFT